MADDLRTILPEILKKQNEAVAAQMELFAQLEALRLTLHTLDARANPIFEQVLRGTRDKYAQELQRLQAEIEYARSTASKLVH
jgi:hypothetical protein